MERKATRLIAVAHVAASDPAGGTQHDTGERRSSDSLRRKKGRRRASSGAQHERERREGKFERTSEINSSEKVWDQAGRLRHAQVSSKNRRMYDAFSTVNRYFFLVRLTATHAHSDRYAPYAGAGRCMHACDKYIYKYIYVYMYKYIYICICIYMQGRCVDLRLKLRSSSRCMASDLEVSAASVSAG